jgi:sialic acid synthase SpsE
MGEIDEAVRAIRGTGNEDFILLQCITMYPAPFEQANIRAMSTLREAFQCQVGYSDHTPGMVIPLGAVALGGCVVEKHFTDDKKRNGPDHPFAMDFEDFKLMVDSIRILESALGNGVKDISPCESETVILQRRSLFAARDISKGMKISDSMVTALRPQKGLLPKYKPTIIGRTARVDIKCGEPITWEKV